MGTVDPPKSEAGPPSGTSKAPISRKTKNEKFRKKLRIPSASRKSSDKKEGKRKRESQPGGKPGRGNLEKPELLKLRPSSAPSPYSGPFMAGHAPNTQQRQRKKVEN